MEVIMKCSNIKCEKETRIISNETNLERGVNVCLTCQACTNKKISLDRSLVLVCKRCGKVINIKKNAVFNSSCECRENIYGIDIHSEMSGTNIEDVIVDEIDEDEEDELVLDCAKCRLSQLDEVCPFLPKDSAICKERFTEFEEDEKAENIIDDEDDEEDIIEDDVEEDIIEDVDDEKELCLSCTKYKEKKKKCKKNCTPNSNACNKHYTKKIERNK